MRGNRVDQFVNDRSPLQASLDWLGACEVEVM